MSAIDALLATSRRRRSIPVPEDRRSLREEAGLTQAEVAQALGVSRPTVVRWENGERTPRGRLLDDYVKLLTRLARDVAR